MGFRRVKLQPHFAEARSMLIAAVNVDINNFARGCDGTRYTHAQRRTREQRLAEKATLDFPDLKIALTGLRLF